MIDLEALEECRRMAFIASFIDSLLRQYRVIIVLGNFVLELLWECSLSLGSVAEVSKEGQNGTKMFVQLGHFMPK